MNTVEKIDVYRIAVELFNNYYSYPQVVEMIRNVYDFLDVDEVKRIVDFAMTGTFDKAANHALKLFSSNSYNKS